MYRAGLLFACAWVTVPLTTSARTLENALVSTFPGELHTDAEGFAEVFARTVANSFPVTGASASRAYRFDPTTDSVRRLDIPLGPVFSERVETVGYKRFSLGVNYLLVEYDTINGHDLDGLVSRDPTQPGDHIVLPVNGVIEPLKGSLQIDLEAQIVALTATYGLTPNLDVNVLLPIVRTSLRSSTQFVGPDPRAPPNPKFQNYTLGPLTTSEASTGVGDLLLRAKQVVGRFRFADIAAGLTLSLPTGSRSDFHGTGDTQIGVAAYASHTYAGRIEPHLNVSFVLDADKFDRSQVRYSAGADVRVLNWLTLNNDFLGRSDIAQPDSIDRPVFFQIERTDVFQFSTGLKLAPPWRETFGVRGPLGLPWVWFFNALLPLNDDGLRANLILTFGLEVGF